MTILFLILTCLCSSISYSKPIDESTYICSYGKIWECGVWMTQQSAVDVTGPHQTNPTSNRRKKPANLYFSYLNKACLVNSRHFIEWFKVNEDDGSIYVAARLKIELQQMVLENATGMSIQFVPKDQRSSPIYYQAQLVQRIPIPDGYTVSHHCWFVKLIKC